MYGPQLSNELNCATDSANMHLFSSSFGTTSEVTQLLPAWLFALRSQTNGLFKAAFRLAAAIGKPLLFVAQMECNTPTNNCL